MNELDALVNIDLNTRVIKPNHTRLNIVRIGTSGSLQADIPVDSWVMSKYAIGLDNMLRSYLIEEHTDSELENAFISHTNWDVRKGRPTVVSCDETLENKIYSEKFYKGFTGTVGGFYGPQGRVVRLNIQDPELNHKMDTFNYNGIRITNLEMETAAIYGLGKLLGHTCLSLNAIIANRALGEFSSNPEKTVNELIAYTLDKLVA
jgi:uridine phosphorylase